MTLAEILIVLGIIGIIAALTIPNLIVNYQKQQAAMQLKSVYSIFQQATAQSTVDNEPVSNWDFSLNNDNFFSLYYEPYLRIQKKCTVSPFCRTTNLHDLSNTTMSGVYPFVNPTYILSNGVFVCYNNASQWHSVIVDLNGNTQPNRIGKDVFVFAIYGNGFHTYDQYKGAGTWQRQNMLSTGSSGQCNKNASGGVFNVGGAYCSKVMEMDGWQILDGYPW